MRSKSTYVIKEKEASSKGIDGGHAHVADETFLGTHVAPILSSKKGSAGVALFFVSLSAFFGAHVPLLEVGLGVVDVVPDDSFVVDFVDSNDKYWEGNTFKQIQLVIKGDIYTNPTTVQEMKDLWTWVETNDFGTMNVLGKVGTTTGTWYDSYTTYLDSITANHFDPSSFYGKRRASKQEQKEATTSSLCFLSLSNLDSFDLR
jgi:hypothetical protein